MKTFAEYNEDQIAFEEYLNNNNSDQLVDDFNESPGWGPFQQNNRQEKSPGWGPFDNFSSQPDEVEIAKKTGDLRKLIDIWKTSKRDGDAQSIQRRRSAIRAMRELSPEWFAAQVRRAQSRKQGAQ